MKKYAVITMDVEDWYHTYFPEKDVDRSYSLLDGLDVALDYMDTKNIKGSFFVVGEIADTLADKLRRMDRNGHDIACHNWVHFRPVTMSLDDFRAQAIKAKEKLEEILGHPIYGYRAPSFGIGDEQFNIIQEIFEFDSSYCKPQKSPKYGKFGLSAFKEVIPCVFKKGNFTEFEISTQKFRNINILLGGGYIRMLPWPFMKLLIARYLASGQLYVMYIHPIDLSPKSMPKVYEESFDRYIRTHIVRGDMIRRFKTVIKMLEDAGYEFVTFEQLRKMEL